MRLTRLVASFALCLMWLLATDAAGQNGITVGPAKVYDNRSLVIMLEQLQAQLRAVQVVDQQKLAQTLGSFQGGQMTDVARAFSLTAGLGTPKVTTTETPVGDELAVTKRETERAATGAPSAPVPPASPASLAFTPSFNVRAEDLLADQISLTYQIFNIRMLLERALSDRLHNSEPRLQVVLGFQIDVNPGDEAKGRAAVVELTITGTTNAKPVSLVSVMPSEKTYNAYALDRRSNAFGGAAVASVVTIGYGEQRRQETLYLYRDSDTLALLPASSKPESESTTFGWQFRPVLGRKSVSAGVRQMFAVLALPEADKGSEGIQLKVTARAYWRKYSAKNLTLSARQEMASASDVDLGEVTALPTEAIDERLHPRVECITWRRTDADAAVVTIAGSNLFAGSQVLLGSRIYESPASGLLFKSDRVLELRSSVRDLAFGDGALSGRYGPPVPLEVPFADTDRSGILINQVNSDIASGRSFVAVEVVLQDRKGKNLEALPSSPDQPLMTVGPAVASGLYATPRECYPTPDFSAAPPPRLPGSSAAASSTVPDTRGTLVKCVSLIGSVPASALEKEALVTVRYPFRGDAWKSEAVVYRSPPFAVLRIGGEDPVSFGIVGSGFGEGWRIVLDKDYFPDTDQSTPTLLIFKVAKQVLGNYKKLIVKPKYSDAVILDIPDAKPAPAEPKLDAGLSPKAKKDTSVSIVLTGNGLGAVTCVKFEGKVLTSQAENGGKTLRVFLTREVTGKPGEAVILLETASGILPVTVLIEP